MLRYGNFQVAQFLYRNHTGNYHIGSKRICRNLLKNRSQNRDSHQPVWNIDIPNGFPIKHPYAPAGYFADNLPRQRLSAVCPKTTEKIIIFAPCPKLWKCVRRHLIVGIHLKNPVKPGGGRVPVSL